MRSEIYGKIRCFVMETAEASYVKNNYSYSNLACLPVSPGYLLWCYDTIRQLLTIDAHWTVST